MTESASVVLFRVVALALLIVPLGSLLGGSASRPLGIVTAFVVALDSVIGGAVGGLLSDR